MTWFNKGSIIMSYRFNKLDMLAVDLKRKLYTIDDVEKVKYD
jgi:hypothetical protein